MFLSYSGWKLYRDCPRSYVYRYVEKTLLPLPDNKVNALYGTVVGILFENFFKRRLWKTPNPAEILLNSAAQVLDAAIEDARVSAARDAVKVGADPEVWREAAIRWHPPKGQPKVNYNSTEAILVDVRVAIANGIEILRQHRLIGTKVGTEVVLDCFFGEHKLIGRADFILRRDPPDDDLVITDGKGSRHRERYVDVRQLHWYSMLFQRQSKGKLPDKVGFVFWREPPDTAVEWHPIGPDEVRNLQEDVLADVDAIETGKLRLARAVEPARRLEVMQDRFPVLPGPGCRLCAYVPVCETGKKMLAESKKTPDDVPTGVEDVGL